MKAMILAAGKGERMLPLTNATPKPLLVVKGRPLIVHHLLALAAAGITEVVINVWHLGEQIVAALGDGSEYGVQIHYSVEPQLLNTGGGIVHALSYLGNEPFLVLSADIFTDFALATLPHNPTRLAHIVMVDNPDYHDEGDFQLDHGTIKIVGNNKQTYANIGVYRREFFVQAPLGAFGLGDLLRKHIAAGLVTGQYYNGSWYNIGTPVDLEMVNTLL